MGYYVIAQDGNRYGPADIPTLQQWVREGRIAPDNTLEDEFTGTQIRASLLPELSHLFASQSPPPRTKQYPLHTGAAPSAQAIVAVVLGVLGLLTFWMYGIPALAFGTVATILGKQELSRISAGLAPIEGRGLAQAGYVLGVTSLVLGIVFVIIIIIVIAVAVLVERASFSMHVQPF